MPLNVSEQASFYANLCHIKEMINRLIEKSFGKLSLEMERNMRNRNGIFVE